MCSRRRKENMSTSAANNFAELLGLVVDKSWSSGNPFHTQPPLTSESISLLHDVDIVGFVFLRVWPLMFQLSHGLTYYNVHISYLPSVDPFAEDVRLSLICSMTCYKL